MKPKIISVCKRSLVLLTFTLTLLLALAIPAGAASKVRLNASKKTLCVGRTLTLRVKGTSRKVTWKSSRTSVAKVSSKGKVTAKKAGKATITAKVGRKKLKCVITVKNHAYGKADKSGKAKCSRCKAVKQVKKQSAPALVPLKKLNRYTYFKKYMTNSQFQKAYNAAAKIVKPLLGKSKQEQLVGIMTGLREYFDNNMTYSMSAPHYNDPYGYFIKKSASCAGCARATGLCLSMLGFKYEHVNENQYTHQWARVKIGKKYWICDAYGLCCEEEPAPRKHPLFS